jgi:hypothetical protein
MLACASSVEPPMCGVSSTLSKRTSGDSKRASLPCGSLGNTSIAAPCRWPLSSASASASMSTTVPREALMRWAPRFIAMIHAELLGQHA